MTTLAPHILTAHLCHSAYNGLDSFALVGDCNSHQTAAVGSMFPQDCSLLGWLTPCFGSLMQTKEVFAVPGGAEGLVRLLGSSSNMELLVEIAWVICHATHSQADANRLVHLGLVQPAVRQIHACVLQVWVASRMPCFYSSHKHHNHVENADNGTITVAGIVTATMKSQQQ